jgi:ABC-type lipopolysaccharide export system ATPase subunit
VRLPDRLFTASLLRRGLLDRHPPSLSPGERRRTELALVLLRRPDCLLADEPFRGLAPYEAEVASAVLRRLSGDGCAVVVTGHEVPTLFGIAGRVVWRTDGTTRELGTPAAAVADWQFRREYLGLLQWA